MRWILERLPQIAAVFFWLGTIWLIYTYMDSNDLTFAEVIAQLETTLRDNWYGPPLFIFIFVFIRPFTLIPAIVLAALGGRVFGLEWGFVYGMIGKTLTAIIPYYAGRLFASKNIDATTFSAPGMRRSGQKIARFLHRNAFESLLAMRLINVPFDIVSFIAGNINLRFNTFMLATFLGNISDVYAFAALGASVEGDILQSDFSVNGDLVITSVLVLIVSAIIAVFLRRRQARLEQAELDRIR